MDVETYVLAKNQAKAYTDTVVTSLATGYTYKGSVSSVSELPATATKGWMYTVTGENNSSYVYDGTSWICISQTTYDECSTTAIDSLFA